MKEYFSKKSPKATVLKLIAIQLVFSILLYYVSEGLSNITSGIVIAWVVFFLIVIYGIVNAIQNKPTLIIDKNGITENSSLNSCGNVDWDNINNIEIRKGVNTDFLCFDIVDDGKILESVSPLKRLLMKSNKRKLGTICVVPEISLNDNMSNVLNEIKKYNKNCASIQHHV